MRTVSLAALLTVLALPAVAATEAEPFTLLAQSYAQSANQHLKSPRAAAYLVRLHGLRDDLEDLGLLEQTYERLSDGGHPLVRPVARQLLVDLHRTHGQLTRANERIRQLGFVTDFYVVGSFDNEGKAGCEVDQGPEAKLDLAQTFPVRGREVAWRRLPVKPGDGYVDLSAVVRPTREAVVYAATWLSAPREMRVTLGLGTSGAHRLWVNGELASKSDRYNSPRLDQHRVSVALSKGPNRVLVKLCQESGPLGLFLRQDADQGSTAQVSASEVAPAPGKTVAVKAQPQPTLTEWFAAETRRSDKDPVLLGEYASVLGFFRAFDEREHLPIVTSARAAELAPKDAELQLLAAQLQTDDANLRRKHLEAALAVDPSSPRAKLALALHELSREHPERAIPLLTGALETHPRFAAARLALARAHEALGEWPRALQMYEDAFAHHSKLPQVVREAARNSRRLDRAHEAVTRLRVALALRFDDQQSRRALISTLGDLARVDEAVREYELALKLDPYDNAARAKLATLLSANKGIEAAERHFKDALALSPDEPELHEAFARELLHAGNKDAAIAALERSLQLRPQNPSLKEAVRTLKNETGGHGERYAFDLAPLSKEADAWAKEDAVYLADYNYVRVQPTGLSARFHQLGVKVFSQRGVEQWRSYSITYSPNRQEVRVLRARITKPDGSVIDSLSVSERNVNEPWSGMYYDQRAKVLSFPQLAPGDVLELVYRLEDSAQDNLLSDYWGDVDYVQSTTPKLRYRYIADMPKERSLYWNQSKVQGVTHEREESDGRVVYRWDAREVKRVVPEPSMPGWAEVVTTLHVSTYKTWDQVGRYYWGLVRDQLTPNDELRKTTEEVLANVDRKDELAVVRAIYSFVVTNTRYVALEFGIHGYKPYRVDRVLARRFGDCKDKASLIHAMLKVAGIDSRLVLLRMRNLGSIGEEPASLAAFNHAIAYVPKFDLYLDGTAEFHGARELPSADRVANVLIVQPEGNSTFLTTPEAKPEENASSLTFDVALRPDGSAGLVGKSKVYGSSAPEMRRGYQSEATRKALFEQSWAQTFPGLTVQKVALSDTSQLDRDVELDYELEVPRYAEVLGDRALRFYPFGGGRAFAQTFASLAERRFDLVMSAPWLNSGTYRFQLPKGYAVRSLPPPVVEKSPFGEATLSCAPEAQAVTCTANVSFSVARVKAADYPAFRDFLLRVDQAFARKLVLAPEQTAHQTPR